MFVIKDYIDSKIKSLCSDEFLFLDKAQALKDVMSEYNATEMSHRVANFTESTPYSPEEIEHCHGWISSVMVRHIA